MSAWIALLTACSVTRYLARGPVIEPAERAIAYPSLPAAVSYTGPSQSAVPVLPILAWGAAYDLDIVLVSDHPAWDMHELARLSTPDGARWVVKEARRGTLEQIATVDLDAPDTWLPELPVLRHAASVAVDDRSDGRRLDLRVAWTTPDGEPAAAEVRGPMPRKPAAKRNGPTLGHSRDQLLAVLDVSARSALSHATLEIGGQKRKIKRLLGLVPFQFALVQAQGGFAIGSWETAAEGDGFRSVHAMRSGGRESLAWTVSVEGARVHARQTSALRTLDYALRRGPDGALELEEIAVVQAGVAQPVTRVAFSPALPDLSRPFSGTAVSRWVIDVNGQSGHAIGQVRATADASGVTLDWLPLAPAWVADRPMRTRIALRADGADSETVRMYPSDSPGGVQ